MILLKTLLIALLPRGYFPVFVFGHTPFPFAKPRASSLPAIYVFFLLLFSTCRLPHFNFLAPYPLISHSMVIWVVHFMAKFCCRQPCSTFIELIILKPYTRFCVISHCIWFFIRAAIIISVILITVILSCPSTPPIILPIRTRHNILHVVFICIVVLKLIIVVVILFNGIPHTSSFPFSFISIALIFNLFI